MIKKVPKLYYHFWQRFSSTNGLLSLGAMILGWPFVPSTIHLISIIIFLYYAFSKRHFGILNFIFLVIAAYLNYSHYKLFFSIDSGFSFLYLLQILKLTELKSKRDYYIHVCLIFILISIVPIFEQGLLWSLMIIFMFLGCIYALWKHEANNSLGMKFDLKFFASIFKVFLYITPLVIVLFIFFPRFEIPIPNIGQSQSMSGFSPEADPRDVAEIVLSDEVVFNADFADAQIPPLESLYWVGAELSIGDGLAWKVSDNFISGPIFNENKEGITYSIQLKQGLNEYLFTLDTPGKISNLEDTYYSLERKTFKLLRKTPKKLLYQASSNLINVSNSKIQNTNHYLKVPDYINNSNRIIQLIEPWKNLEPNEKINKILDFFKDQKFIYSLSPGKTPSLDYFLFANKKGFCTHYATALATLARILNVPSKVVVGFQGGEKNQYSNFVTVRGKDAHAWTEVYIENKGWIRIDPVGVLAPERLTMGGQEFFSTTQKSALSQLWTKVTLGLGFLDNEWSKLISSYDFSSQLKIASLFKLEIKEFFQMAIFIPLIILFLILALMTKKSKLDPELIIYGQLLKKLGKVGLNKMSNEGPEEFLIRIKNVSEKVFDLVKPSFDLFIKIRYSNQKNIDLKLFKILVSKLSLKNKN